MPSSHHIGFQKCPLQVDMMVIQGLVHSSQDLGSNENRRMKPDPYLCNARFYL